MGRVQIFTGDGYGKTMAALGEALIAAASGKQIYRHYRCPKQRHPPLFHYLFSLVKIAGIFAQCTKDSMKKRGRTSPSGG